MTIKPEVLAALSVMDAQWPGYATAKQTIRADITRLSEIAEQVDPLVIQLGEVITKLGAANALLREATEWNWMDEPVCGMDELAQKIEAHLQGAGDEA
jgi:L-fucose mutarotase/ribose pyranase (RbsD/FucU family)